MLLAACGAAGNTPASEPEPVLTDLPVEENIPDETESTEAASVSTAPEFDIENGIVTLNNGISMPILGIGTFVLSNSEAEVSAVRLTRALLLEKKFLSPQKCGQ